LVHYYPGFLGSGQKSNHMEKNSKNKNQTENSAKNNTLVTLQKFKRKIAAKSLTEIFQFSKLGMNFY